MGDDDKKKTEEHKLEELLAAVESAGSKINLRELFRLLGLLKVSTAGFMLTALFVLLGSVFTLGVKSVDTDNVVKVEGALAWGSLQGQKAHDSFNHGGDGTKLSGEWKVDWWVDTGSGEEERYSYFDHAKKQKVVYPTETITVTAVNAVVSAWAMYSSNEGIRYWYEGRVSSGDRVTLVYWVESGDGREKLVGSVFLTFEEGLKDNYPSTMTGHWSGFVRDGKVVKGRTVWTKQEE